MNNETLMEAFATLKNEYIAAWKITHFKNSEGREQLWQAVNIVDKVRDHLVKLVNNGKLATKDLAQLSHNLKPK